ncbi:MAG TPA: IPTL-CTERM sorting domain-containing protein [Thermoanaerobaculia bacterium]|nr:IPTL-CTERM sorting domain-containing protein [Thermoanaerobaculia bacterium]
MCAALTAGYAALAQTAPRFGDAASFVVLGNGSVTNSGATQITGNVGVSPGNTVTGLSSSNFLLGDVRRDDALARAARGDGNGIDDELAGTACDVTLTNAELGGKRLTRGAYRFSSANVTLSGPLILDAEGNRDAVWIFRIDGTLTTAPGASVLVVGNGYDGNVYWRTGDGAMIGERTSFIGNLFAAGNIVFQDRASLSGRAISRNGSVSLSANRLSLCCAPITVSPPSVPNGTLGTDYSEMFTADGGVALYTFAITSGSLPSGLTLDPTGALHGKPEQTGTFAFTVTATDAAGCTGSAAYTMEIDCPEVTLSSLPPMVQGVPYDETIVVTGGGCEYSLTADTLPEGIVIDGLRIHGTPTQSCPYTFTITAVDRTSGCSGTRHYTFGCCRLHITPTTLPNGRVGVAYPEIDFSVDGGTAPYTFTIASGRPPGLRLTGDTLSGTPTTAGTYAFRLRVTDRNGCTDIVDFCAIDIASGTCPGMATLALSPDDLPRATPGVPYVAAITPSGGTPLYTLTVSKGELPAGLVLTPPGIGGSTTETGAFPLIITATDSNGCRVSRCYTLFVGTPIPTLSQWALLLVAALLSIAGCVAIGRR